MQTAYTHERIDFVCPDGKDRPADLYTGRIGSDVYQIMLISGLRFYRVNDGPLSNLICDICAEHYDLEQHFGLGA